MNDADKLPAAPPNDDDLLLGCPDYSLQQLLDMEATAMIGQIAETIDAKIMGRLIIANDFPRPK